MHDHPHAACISWALKNYCTSSNIKSICFDVTQQTSIIILMDHKSWTIHYQRLEEVHHR